MRSRFYRIYLAFADFLIALERLPMVGPWLAQIRPRVGRWVQRHFDVDRRLIRHWQSYTDYILAVPDNALIPRVADAGKIVDGYLIMHNGLRMEYGQLGAALGTIERNRGVFEPQQERIFGDIVALLPAGAIMVELGSNWAFYSLWFHKAIADAQNYMVEPDPRYLEAGQRSFAINQAEGVFIHGAVGAVPGMLGDLRMWTLDELAATYAINHIHLLHVDIDGAELDMLKGAQGLLAARRVDYIVLSTHSVRSTQHAQIHVDCRARLTAANYEILADVESPVPEFRDGLLVMRRAEFSSIDLPEFMKSVAPTNLSGMN